MTAGADLEARLALARQLRSEQSFWMAAVVGVFTAVVMALVWVLLSLTHGGRTGGLVVLVGLAVGIAVQLAGRGLTWHYRVLGAALAALGIGLGHTLLAGVMGSMVMGVGPLRALAPGNIGDSFWLYGGLMRPLDTALGALGVLLAGYFSRRRLNPHQRRALFAEEARQ